MTTPILAERTASPGTDPGGVVRSPLGRCFALTPQRFAAEHWNRRPLLVRAAERAGASPTSETEQPWAFEDLLSPAAVDDLVGPRGLRTPFFTMVSDGAGLPRDRFTRRGRAGNVDLTDLPDPDGIAAAHADGATLVLQALHRVWPPLASFCRDLSAELGHATQVNAYITPPGAQGFKPHHDTHDVIVLQVDGRKHWTIHPPSMQLPLASQPSSQLGPDPVGGRPAEIDTVLEPGDALYLPRGWLHSAQTTDERSIHLTVGLLATTWADVLSDLAAGAGRSHVGLRHALALPGLEGVGIDAGPAAFRQQLRAWVEGLDDDAIAAAVAGRRASAVTVEPVGPLAQDHATRTLDARARVRPRVGLTSSVQVEGERAVLRLPGRSVSFPAWTEAGVRAALAGPTSAGDLAAAEIGFDLEDAVVLLRRLLRERVVLPC